MTLNGKNRIMIFGPEDDGTYVVEFRTAEGEALVISIPRSEAAVIRHFQERMPYRLFGCVERIASTKSCAAAVPKVGQCPSGFMQSGAVQALTDPNRVNFILPNLRTRLFVDGRSDAGAYVTKGPIIPIVLVLGIIVLGATAVLFLLNPASRAEAPNAQSAAAFKSDAPALSTEARVALSDIIQAQGFNCPSVSDGTPSGEDQSGQVIRVRCDNDLSFKVTMRPQGPMMFAVAPWQ
jgi:hypothetical protein